ncbi:hypothetical protein [Streptomyces hebeiensis]
MNDSAADPSLWGAVSITVSLIALALALLHASVPRSRAEEAWVPIDAEEGYTYTCYCTKDPVHITVPTSRAHRLGRTLGADAARR